MSSLSGGRRSRCWFGSVLDHLAGLEGQPRIGRVIDIRRWWRYGQENFVGLQSRAWLMPADVPIVGWLEKFPEMTAVRQAYNADSVLGARVDTLIGTEFSRHRRNFDWLLIEHIVQPMVLATGMYGFDEAVFDRFYDRFERGSAQSRSTWLSSFRSTASSRRRSPCCCLTGSSCSA